MVFRFECGWFTGVTVGAPKRVSLKINRYPDDGSGYGERLLLWVSNDILVFGDESLGGGGHM